MRAPLIQLLAEAEVASSQASYILAGLAGALVLLMAAVKCGTLLTNPSARKYFFGSLALLVVIAPLGYLGVRYTGAFIEGFKTALAGGEQPSAAVAAAEKKENAEASAPGEPSEFAKSDNDVDGEGTATDDAPKVTHVAHEVTQRSTNPNTTQQFPELNFEFTPPDVGWIKLHAPSVSHEAAVAYTSKAPQMIFFVIAERLGADVQVTNEALFDIIKSNIYANYDEVEVSEPVPQTLAGIEGLGFTVNYAERAVDQRRAMWIGSQGGFLFQLVTTGRAKNADRLDERHRQMLAGFRVIDQSALVYSQGREPIAKFASKEFGYEVDLSGAPWLQAAGELQILSAAEMAATLKGKAAVAFVPVQIPHDGATIDDVATVLASGLVDELDAESRENVEAKPADADGVEELSFGYQLKAPSGADVAYRFRVLRQGRRAVMGVGLAPAQEAEALQEIEKGIATLRFTGPAEARNDSGTAEQQIGRGMVLNTMGLEAFDQHRQELSLACFEEAIRLLPNNPTPTLNYAHVLAESGRLEDAIAALEKRIGECEESHRLQEKLASLLFEAGDDDRCAETLKRLLSDGYRSEDALVILVGVYMKQEKYQDALAAVDDYLKGGVSPQASQMKAVLLSKVGDHEGAIALLEETRKQHPRDPSSALNLAVAYCEAERFDEALALTQQLLDQGKATDEVYLVRGRCYLDMKQYAEAKAAFEQAHAANPRSREAEEAIAVASALLGQGNNSIVKTPIDPVPLPEEIAGRLTQIAPDDRVAGAFGAYEHFRVVGYDYLPGERWRTTTYRKIKIVGQEGVDRFATLNVTFSPLSERLFVNRLAVYDAAGKLLAEGNPNDYYVVADAKSDLATGDSTLTIPVPQLLPGNTLEYTLTREQLSTVKEFGYEEVILTGSIPVQAAAAFVVGDVSKLAHTSSGPEPRTSASGGLFWGVTEPPVFVDESSQPPIAEFLPVIHLADAGQQWETIGNEYAQKIADRLQPDPVSEAKARELTAGLATPAEKIAVLSRFVQKQLNYQGLEFGVRGLIPNTAAKSLEIGYGDCKDHSVLLKQLLNAAGLPAQLTLVNATGEVDGRLPSPSQFDHMIVSMPGPDGGDQGRVFIDCTSKHANPLDVTCDDFSGASALVIEPSGSRLVSIPPRSTVSTDIRCSREITVVCDEPNRETADAVVREQVSFSATPANVLRAALTSMQPRDRKETVSRLISEHDSIDMTRLEFLNLEDPTLPLVIELEYRMDNVFHRVGERGSPFTGRIVSPWEAWATLAYTLTERATPFRTTNASVAGTTRYVLPAGFTMDRGLETIEAPTTNRFLLWRIEADRANQTATVSVSRRAGSHAAAEYQPCALEAKELADRLRRPISIVEIPATARAEEGSTLR